MLGHTPQCSGVSTQVLAECTPALAGEGRKNQSLLVPNVLERAEERRSTLEGVSESRTGRGETEASGSPHRLAKGKQRSTPAWTWVRRAPARRSRPTRSAGTSRAQERRGCRAERNYKMNSGARDAAQTGHKRQATKTGRHVVTQGSLGDGGVLRRRGEPELGRNLFRRRELQRD